MTLGGISKRERQPAFRPRRMAHFLSKGTQRYSQDNPLARAEGLLCILRPDAWHGC